MLDCGIDEHYTPSNLDALTRELKLNQVDFIFLSHASIHYIGALPYLQSRGFLDSIKVMSTSPIAKLGALTMYEYFIQRKESGNFDGYTL